MKPKQCKFKSVNPFRMVCTCAKLTKAEKKIQKARRILGVIREFCISMKTSRVIIKLIDKVKI